MPRSRLSKALGALACSIGLVAGGAFTTLPSMAAEDDSFSVTVRVVDKDTGMLIGGKLSTSHDGSFIFDNGGTISISKDNVIVDDNGKDLGTDFRVVFASGTEEYAKYQEPDRDEWTNCRFYFADAGKTVTCTVEKKPYSTTLEAVDEDGNPVTPKPDDFFPSGYFYGDTLYYDNQNNFFSIQTPGYLKQEINPEDLVNGGTTRVVLKKAPTKEVLFKFVDAMYYSQELEGTTAKVRPLRFIDNDEEYSVTHGVPVTLPDYSSEGNSTYVVHLDSSSKLYFGDELITSLSDETIINVKTLHVRVEDEYGNLVPGALVSIVDTALDIGFDGTVYSTDDDKRSEDFSSTADEDIVYVPLVPDSGCYGEYGCMLSKIAVSVVAPVGYEHINSDPVEFLHTDDVLDDYIALGMTPDGRVDYSYFNFDDWRYMLGEYVIITLRNLNDYLTPPDGDLNEPGEDPTLSCDDSDALCDDPYDPDKKPTTAPTVDPTMDPTTDPTTDPSAKPTGDPTGNPTSPSANPTTNAGAGTVDAAAGNPLSATGASVGIAALSALTFIGAGFLLRRRLHQ